MVKADASVLADEAVHLGPIAPHDAAAESRVLGALLIDRDAIIRVADFLGADDFYLARHQRVYDAIRSLFERHEPIDPLTVRVELQRKGELDRAGGAAALGELQEAVATAVDVERDGQVVAGKALLRRLLAAAQDIAALAYDEPTDLDLTLDRAEQRVFALLEQGRASSLRHIREALTTAYDRIAYRMDNPMDVVGVATGFAEIDVPTNGLQRGDLFILGARPAVGKSSLALNIAYKAAKRGSRVLVFSLEMSREQIAQRLMAVHASIDILHMRRGGRDSDAADGLMGLPIEIDDTPGISVMELRTKARRRKAAAGLDLLVIDYLQLMRTPGDEDNRVQEIATITRSMKALGRELGVGVIALSQLSRAVEERETAEPRLSDLRDAGSIEQDADEVLFLSKRAGGSDAVQVIDCHLAKNRNGPTAKFQLVFEPRYTRFSSKARDQ
jgi:replicative DNA helicase